MKRKTGLLVFAVGLLLAFAHAAAAAPEPNPFYAGKTVRLLIGFGPGGANDVWARSIARHMRNHIAGSPAIVAENYPGAGGLRLMNELYNTLPKDGTVIGLVSRGMPFEPLFQGPGVQFDPLRMNWIGSPDRDTTVCVARSDAPVRSIRDLFARELVVGATGSGADTALYPELLSRLLGMKFKTIKGYQGTKEILVAVERREVDGICIAYDSLMRDALARQGRMTILFQAARESDPRLQGVPVGTDLARSERERAVLRLVFARAALGRPLVLAPGVPPERVALLRQAFLDMLADPRFLQETQSQGMTVSGIPSDALEAIIADSYGAPAAVIADTASALGRAPPANR
jgi:tripartite-type tricarboxylate transporter receptor subunit TctC